MAQTIFTDFLIRIELHQAVKGDYDTLHSAMAARNIGRTITSDTGVVYKLPTAEYYVKANNTAEQIRAIAAEAAASTGKGYEVIVAQCTQVLWQGLPLV